MRILHIADIRGIGGLQAAVRELAAAQARCGHEVQIMVPPWASGRKREECFTELPIHTWEPDLVSGFDIVHTHGTAGFANRKWRRFPVHPAIVHTYQGTIAGIQIAMRWYQNLVGWNGRAVPLGIWYEANSGWGADRVIAVSPKVKREVQRFYRVNENKITVIPNGYSPTCDASSQKELRQRLGLPESGFLFLFVGRPDPVKDFDSVLAAFRKLKHDRNDVSLVVAPKPGSAEGDGVLALELHPQQMCLLYRACDAYINASRYDAYSLAAHEALAYGLPAIIRHGAGNADYCKHSVNALVARDKRDCSFVNVLAEAMVSVLSNPSLRRFLSKNAIRDFGPRTWHWVAKQVETVYQEALALR